MKTITRSVEHVVVVGRGGAHAYTEQRAGWGKQGKGGLRKRIKKIWGTQTYLAEAF